MSGWYQWRGADLLLHCHLQPNASNSAFAGLHGERLKIRIAAPPVDGKANAALIRFLAKAFAVNKTAVAITQGAAGRRKTVAIQAPQTIPAALPPVTARD